jgi:hypothetical protein
MRSVVKAAQEIEKESHKKTLDEKGASWLLKQAKEADLALDDDLQHEVAEKLAGKKRTHRQKGEDEVDERDEIALAKTLFKNHDDLKIRDRNKDE